MTNEKPTLDTPPEPPVSVPAAFQPDTLDEALDRDDEPRLNRAMRYREFEEWQDRYARDVGVKRWGPI